MLFKSKIDWWFSLAIGSLPVLMLATLLPAILAGQMSFLFASFILVISLGLPFWIALATHYRIAEETLVIKCGPFKWVVPINEIESVSASSSALSSPALSMDRLELTYSRGKRILISPADKAGFLNAIGQPSDTS